jgi:hypothetical protein
VDLLKVPTVWSLAIIGALVGGSIAASLLWPKADSRPVAEG